ncbi:hypothetical protein [Cardinium endosymbiont of Oedothorax gibbosus]|uniref:hypothetical protein n=1 Tax=Cardinium endosymbiont of Oedothorax gibbosus TaxID=931101 RepID=UPI0020248F33|nr:hypothetical protein [Cardinium endosymbiont of Oedothorax gibbosus]
MSTLLLGFQGCDKGVYNLFSKESKDSSSIAFKSPKHQTVSNNVISSKSNSSHFLGVVSYFKMDHNLGLIQIDPANQSGKTESQKMGLLFYAPKSLKHCANMHLSNQEVTLSYLDGSSEVLSILIEVPNEWIDGLSKEKEVESLFHKDACSKLEATCTNDFTIFSVLDYGIKAFNGMSSIVLLESRQDKTRFEDVNHAGFMVTKRTPASTSELVQLVRYLSTNTVHSTNEICSASVCGNRLQPAASPSDDAAYLYIKHGNRYRLISLNNSASSVKEGKAIYKRVIEQVDASSLKQMSQEGVVADGLKKPKQTRDIQVQTEDMPGEDYHSDHENSKFVDSSLYGSSGIGWDFDGCEDNNSNISEDVEWDSDKLEKDDDDGGGQEEEDKYNPEVVKHCSEKTPYYTLYFS